MSSLNSRHALGLCYRKFVGWGDALALIVFVYIFKGIEMRKLLVSVCFILAMAPIAISASAAEKAPSEKQLAQRERMEECNDKAGDKQGDERKKYMSSCLKAPSEKQLAQREKMKTCNKDAADRKLAGKQRKEFMSSCLAG